jgi:hypothetical protein
MLHHCFNPECGQPFLDMSQGKLFQLQRTPANSGETMAPGKFHRRRERSSEHYWLCAPCSFSLTLSTSADGLPRVVSLADSPRKPPSSVQAVRRQPADAIRRKAS